MPGWSSALKICCLDLTHFYLIGFSLCSGSWRPPKAAAFRVSSGFNGLLSLLSDLEGSLQEPHCSVRQCPSQTLDLVLHSLCALSAALCLDPVNSDFFRRTGLFEKLAEDLCLLGCFGALEGRGRLSALLGGHKARPFADLLRCGLFLRQPAPPKIRAACRSSAFWTAWPEAPSTCAGT